MKSRKERYTPRTDAVPIAEYENPGAAEQGSLRAACCSLHATRPLAPTLGAVQYNELLTYVYLQLLCLT